MQANIGFGACLSDVLLRVVPGREFREFSANAIRRQRSKSTIKNPSTAPSYRSYSILVPQVGTQG